MFSYVLQSDAPTFKNPSLGTRKTFISWFWLLIAGILKVGASNGRILFNMLSMMRQFSTVLYRFDFMAAGHQMKIFFLFKSYGQKITHSQFFLSPIRHTEHQSHVKLDIGCGEYSECLKAECPWLDPLKSPQLMRQKPSDSLSSPSENDKT